MNGKNIGIIVAVVTVVAVGGYFMMNQSQGPAGPGGEGPGGQNAALTGGARSLKDLMASGGSQKCTFAFEDEASRSSGVVYFANGKMRGDYESLAKVQGETMESHSISDGEYMYSWSSAMSQGMKVKFADFAAGDAGAPESGRQSAVGYDQKMDYDCGAWGADASVFVPPASVEFIDASALMKGLGGAVPPVSGEGGGSAPAGTPSAASQCAMCDQVPDAEGKAQCKAAFQCP